MTATRQSPASAATALPAGRWRAYPAYKDSGVEWLGQIPAHWSLSKMGAVCTVKARLGWKGLKADEYVDEGYIFLATPNIKGANIDFDNVDHITAERYFESPEIMLAVGDVLIAKDGATLGVSNAVRHLPAPATVNSSIAVVRPSQRLDGVYLNYFVMSDFVQAVIACVKDGMGVPHLFQADLRKFVVLLPPLTEQRAIADFLDRETARLDALVAAKERLIALLQEKRGALISSAVTRGLDPSVPMKDSGVAWLGRIPAHWEVLPLKRVVTYVTSGSRGWAAFLSEIGPMFIRIGNLSHTSVDLDLEDVQHVSLPEKTEGERTRLQPGDILVSITANIGSIGVVPQQLGEAYVNQHVALVRPKPPHVYSRWLAYFLLSEAVQCQFQALLYGGTKDGLGLDDVRSVWLLVPSLLEQRLIVERLDREIAGIDTLIAKVREHIERVREYRAALIAAAVTGKIDVRGET